VKECIVKSTWPTGYTCCFNYKEMVALGFGGKAVRYFAHNAASKDQHTDNEGHTHDDGDPRT
jgi:hypothetical protein